MIRETVEQRLSSMREQRATLLAQQDQLLAVLNSTVGAINALEALLAEWDDQPTEYALPAPPGRSGQGIAPPVER
jgi:hypothetical protein